MPLHNNYYYNKKDRFGSGKPRRQQILFCDIQMKVVISRGQIYVYHTDATTRNLSDLDFDLSRPRKVKFDSAIGLPIYGFLLKFNSTIIWSN